MSNKILNLFKGDKAIWFIYLSLCVISLVEVFSAGSNMAYHGSYWDPLRIQASFLLGGLLVVLAVLHIQYKYFNYFLGILIPLSFILLILTLFKGQEINGANRGITILHVRFQPSELAKMTMVIFTALVMAKNQDEKGANFSAFKWISGALIIFCSLIFTENLSTAALLFIVIVTMMFIGGISIKYIASLVGGILTIGVIMFLIFFAIHKTQETKTNDNITKEKKEKGFLHRADTWVTRIIDFMPSKDKKTDEKKLKKNEQRTHSDIAIATSGFFGKGPGNSVQRDFLSLAALDFIYAIIVEELGLFGGIIVMFLYVWLLIRAGTIAKKCDRKFPAFLVMGIALMMVSQALINMMVAVGLFPITGQPLPLISKGGTNLLINCGYIGMILSISRYTKQLDLQKLQNKKTEKQVKNEIKVDEQPDTISDILELVKDEKTKTT